MSRFEAHVRTRGVRDSVFGAGMFIGALLSAILYLIRFIAAELIDLLLAIIAFLAAVAAGVVMFVNRTKTITFRAASVALFVGGLVLGWLNVGALYTAIGDWLGALLVCAALAFLMVFAIAYAQQHFVNIWSALVGVGLLGLLLAFLASVSLTNANARLIARALPVTLAAAGLVYLAMKFKRRNDGRP